MRSILEEKEYCRYKRLPHRNDTESEIEIVYLPHYRVKYTPLYYVLYNRNKEIKIPKDHELRMEQHALGVVYIGIDLGEQGSIDVSLADREWKLK